MIRLLKNNYLKSRVISLSYQIDKVMIEYAKQGFEDPEEIFLETDPMKYYEAEFLAHVTSRWNVEQEFFSKPEWDAYNEGLKKLEHFRNMKEFVENMHDFYWEVRNLYLEITRELATPNSWNRREHTTYLFQNDAKSSLEKYTNLMKELEPYPEWQDKVKNDIGYHVHLIYNSLTQQKESMELFKDFHDLHYFFK